MNVRKIAFNLQDLLKGNIVSNHLNQLVEYYNDENSSNKQLELLLNHARNNVEYYKNQQHSELSAFPVVDKTIIKDAVESFKAKNYVDKVVISMTTSGSTGTPFTVVQDVNKKARNHADTIYFGKLGGYEIGNRLLYLKIWAKVRMSNPLVYKAQNIIPIDVIALSDSQIQDVLNQFAQNRTVKHNILGYVSALEHILRYCEKANIKRVEGNVAGIITMSEGLSKETKQKLKVLFNCSVVSRYSNLENGILAQQLANDDRFLINTASYKIEIIDQVSNQIVEDGKIGRIVVTDLYNFAMPLIRYDTGDLGSIIRQGHQIYLNTIEGRKLDVLFDTSGNLVSSYIMYKNMWQYTEIAQYQLIQTEEKAYVFKINSASKFLRESQLVQEFKEYLGADADFKVEYVTEIPLLDSGKRRKTVNLYKKSVD